MNLLPNSMNVLLAPIELDVEVINNILYKHILY